MIFVTLGSQKFQFNRLLKAIDELVEKKQIEDDIFAQIGYSDYKPVNYKYKDFLDRGEFKKAMGESSIVITHGGTGAIVGAIKQGKKVIAVPRLAKFEEHVDDHQLQIIGQFTQMNLIKAVYDMSELKDALEDIKVMEFKKYVSNTLAIEESIDKYIETI
ncbi:MAG: beta(1,3)galactosyltransferase EpsH [Clostridium sp.]|nr:beta(1,3)galactosyltransferase EpsH [Clostridium sp.]